MSPFTKAVRVSLFAFLVLACLNHCSAQESTVQDRPNIVLIISDDDDYEHFGFMGDKIAHTPSLDALATSGSLFTTAHCPAPLCRPSLASMLSGKLPHQHGIYANYLQTRKIGTDELKLDPEGSLANQLKNAGYATYATAKYWEGDPRAMGFTHGTVKTTFKGFQNFVRSGQNELIRFIDEEGKEKPMFIWWAPLLPHKPHNPPAKYLQRFADVAIPIPSFFDGDRDAYTKAIRNFYAMGSWLDDGVADLIEQLKSAGEYKNTIFLFYIDNGYSFGTPAKNSPTEKGLRTPMFVSWPGNPGKVPIQRTDELSYALDLHATALDYAGINPATDIASRSLRPRIEGEVAKPKETIFGAVFAHAPAAYSGDPQVERSAARDVYALYARTGRWKYVLYTQDLTEKNDRYIWMVHEMSDAFRRNAGDESLFDLKTDPYEQQDLAAEPKRKAQTKRLRQQVLQWWHDTGGKRLSVESHFPIPARTSDPKTSQSRMAPSELRYQVGQPPAELQLDAFYQKYVDASGYPIVSSGKVTEYALKEAAYLIDLMLAQRPDLRKTMVDHGSRMIVMAHDEFTTDIPEYSDMRPKDFWDARARGLGGSKEDPICSCAEENLLAYPGDPYATENILIHEFAHNIHLVGLANLDPSFDDRLKQTYDRAIENGLWQGKYAATNHAEYFAEGVQSWFNNNRAPDHDHNHVNTRTELKEYDPGLASICENVFKTTVLTYTKPPTRLRGHLSGYLPSMAPHFSWPKRLQDSKKRILEDARRNQNRKQEYEH